MFRRLECFLAVARLKSFSAAGQYLFLSQSAVSQQISALEKDLGLALFERKGTQTELTPAGAYLYPRVLTLKDTYEHYLSQAELLARGGADELSIGFDGPIAEEWIGRAIDRANKKIESDTHLNLYRASLSTLTDYLIEDVIDLAITTDIEMERLDGVTFVPLAVAHPCVFCAPSHKFASYESVSVEELLGETILGAYGKPHGRGLSRTGEHLVDLGIPAESLTTHSDGDTVFLSVSANMGVFVASHLCDAFAAHRGAASVPLDAPLPAVTMGLAYKQTSPFIEAFTQVAKKALARP
ncbi:MAG: LysR family transcriptional regulator [Eggerthellaceae bacterium]|nr:LysR family transcriptional regulator [Eggerthellaceae bacterium]